MLTLTLTGLAADSAGILQWSPVAVIAIAAALAAAFMTAIPGTARAASGTARALAG